METWSSSQESEGPGGKEQDRWTEGSAGGEEGGVGEGGRDCWGEEKKEEREL